MKKSLLLLAGVLGISSLNAQTTEEQTTKFRDNWSIGLNGGIVTPLTHSAFFKNARATMGLDLNKQFSPIYGLTLENMWSINTYDSQAAFDASNLMLLHRINLNNVFCRYKGKPSLFEVEALGGFGWLHVNDAYEEGDGTMRDGNWITSKAGLNFNFNIGEKKAWTIAVKPAIVMDHDPIRTRTTSTLMPTMPTGNHRGLLSGCTVSGTVAATVYILLLPLT